MTAGVAVGCLLPEADRDQIDAKVGEALRMIERYAPRDLVRLQGLARGVLVFGIGENVGEWHQAARLVWLQEQYVMKERIQAAHVAAVIVHEAMHAWLECRGIRYEETRRGRIEAVCFRREAAFARKVPGGEALAVYYEGCAAAALADESRWSDAAFREQRKRELLAIGVPAWIASTAVRLSGSSAG